MHVLQGSSRANQNGETFLGILVRPFFFLFWDSAVVLKVLVSFVDMHIGTFS